MNKDDGLIIYIIKNVKAQKFLIKIRYFENDLDKFAAFIFAILFLIKSEGLSGEFGKICWLSATG